MNSLYTPYEALKKWRENNLLTHQSCAGELHLLHENILKKVFDITLEQMIKDCGFPPCEFSWFVMGSAGRCEQAIISDQDHGIIYEETSQKASTYFGDFGKKLSFGLDYMGYPYCDGKVMSSNPLWCQSLTQWEVQIKNWMEEDRWETIRYLIIFLDARVVVGKEQPIFQLKSLVYQSIQKNPYLLKRLLENTRYIEKSVGLFNHFLTISDGPYTGCIHLKRTAFLPYVNAVRLLAVKENIHETSTIKRIESLSRQEGYNQELQSYHTNFLKLLQLRLTNASSLNYEDIHYLNVKKLTKEEKQEIKIILKDGKRLFQYTESIINRVIKNEN